MCNNNCCMCCQCNNNTHDEDNPQEITYTSVCDSDACKNRKCCNCCCENGVCEDDAKVLVYGLSEQIEERCEEVHKIVEHVECLIEEINDKNIEQDEKIDDLYNREKFDFNKSIFNSTTQMIEFWHVFPEEDQKDPIHYSEWDIDASNFLKDWFVDDAKLISKRYLELTFNVDAATSTHLEPIKMIIDLYDFIDPGLYYTKDEIDLTVSTINNSITNLANELSAYKTYVSNTYETKVAAGNHINNVDYDQNDHHTLIFTKENGLTITKTIPDSDLYILSGEYTGGNLVLTRNNNTTVTIPVPATNHITGGSINNGVITLTRENNGTPVTITLPTDNNNYVSNATVQDHTLTLTRQGLSDLTVQLPDNNNYTTGASVSGHTLTINRNGLSDLTVSLPDDNDNNYVTGGSVSNNVLTLTRQGLSNVTIQLPSWVTTDNDHYPTAASVDSNRVLHLTGTNFTEVTALLPADVDTNDYPTSGFVDSNDVLTLSSSTNNFPTMTVQLPNYSRTDNDHYVTSGTVDNGVLKLTRLGVSGTVDITLPDVNVTYGGNAVTIQQAITSIENRLNALEGLWEINPSDNTQLIAKNSRSAKAAGFYDSTVN